MFENALDIVEKFAKDNNLVLVGVMILVAVFLASFFLRTFWCQWDDRAKENKIYGEPGANSRWLRKPRKGPPKNSK